MKDRSAHGGGSPETPEDGSPIARGGMRARRRTRGGLSRPRRRPGGLEQSGLVWVGVFLFLLSGGYGEKEIGEPRFDSQ